MARLAVLLSEIVPRVIATAQLGSQLAVRRIVRKPESTALKSRSKRRCSGLKKEKTASPCFVIMRKRQFANTRAEKVWNPELMTPRTPGLSSKTELEIERLREEEKRLPPRMHIRSY
jgi:hypothetical protein